MKILAYRMFFHKPFTAALRKTGKDITFFSSERRSDETGVIDSFYNEGQEATVPREIMYDVITRCRYLSGINLFDAQLKVRKMWSAISAYFDDHQVDMVLSPAVDNYVTDIWFKVASSRGIPAFQPRRSPLPGLVRITNSTDNPELREPNDDEVNRALAHLRKGFKADYQNTTVRSTRQIAQRAGRELVKKIIFQVWKYRYSDYDSFHYNAIFPNKNAITIKSLSQLWYHKRFKAGLEEVIAQIGNYERVVFWPLAMAPESALCYLNASPSFSDYRDVIGKVIDSLDKKTLLLVKEHPSAIGYRAVDHYSKLLGKDNVLVCSPALSTGKVIEISDAVLVNTSSTTGLEAVAAGKPVLALGSCHYKVSNIVEEINSLADVPKWCSVIRDIALIDSEKHQVIRKYLSNTVENATWALAGRGSNEYQAGIEKTLERCIELTNSGYTPSYHVFD